MSHWWDTTKGKRCTSIRWCTRYAKCCHFRPNDQEWMIAYKKTKNTIKTKRIFLPICSMQLNHDRIQKQKQRLIAQVVNWFVDCLRYFENYYEVCVRVRWFSKFTYCSCVCVCVIERRWRRRRWRRQQWQVATMSSHWTKYFNIYDCLT